MEFDHGYLIADGELRAMRDWLNEGAFSNVFEPGTPQHHGYEIAKNRIENQFNHTSEDDYER